MTLAIDGIGFSYARGGEELFGGLTHEFSRSSITALTGPSGRGKSTLLYVLGLMLRPRRGSITFDGRAVGDLPDRDRARFRAETMGFVFQDAVLDPTRRVLDSVCEPALYAGLRRSSVQHRALELLALLGVEERADHRPGEISGGQAQRVAVARALVNDPQVVLADEPTGNLDRASATTVLDALSSAAQSGRAVLIATHDPFVLEYADHVVTL